MIRQDFVAKHLSQWRTLKNIKASWLAGRLDISPGMLSKYEKGVHDMSKVMLEKAAREIEIPYMAIVSDPLRLAMKGFEDS